MSASVRTYRDQFLTEVTGMVNARTSASSRSSASSAGMAANLRMFLQAFPRPFSPDSHSFIGHARHYTYIKINIFLSLLIALYVWLVAGNRPVESSLTVFDIIGNPFSSPASEEMTYG